MVASGEKKSQKIRVKLSKIQFPEICPVCLEEPEDLVFATIMDLNTIDADIIDNKPTEHRG